MRITRTTALGVGAALLLVLTLTGCTTTTVASPGFDRDTVIVAGTGSALSKPDRAELGFALSVSEKNPKVAMSRAAKAADRLVAALKSAGIAEKDLQTTGVTLAPKYRTVRGARQLDGYVASFRVSAATPELGKVGDVIAEGTRAGATSVTGPAFVLSDANKTKYAAMDKAVTDARAKAETLAATAGRRLGPALSVTESGASQPTHGAYSDNYSMALLRAPVAVYAPPVQPGQLESRADVTVVFALE